MSIMYINRNNKNKNKNKSNNHNVKQPKNSQQYGGQ